MYNFIVNYIYNNMFDTVSVSELQKAPSKALGSTKGFKYILSNNKKQGLLVDKNMMEFLEKIGVLEQYEDYVLTHSPKFKSIWKEGEKPQESYLTFDELC